MIHLFPTVGPTEIHACGAAVTTKLPTNVSVGHSRLPPVWFAVFGPGIPRLQPWGAVKILCARPPWRSPPARDGFPSAVEAPARCALRLGRVDADGGVERDAVEAPGRRSGARGIVGSRDGAILHACGPPRGRIALREALERGVVGHLGRDPFNDEVEVRERHR